MRRRSAGWPNGTGRPALLKLACLSLFLTLPPASGSGQTVQGRVLESSSSFPIPHASVTLVDAESAVVTSGSSDGRGFFHLAAPEPGDYYLLVEALGFHPRLDGILEFEEGGSIEVDFYVRPKPFRMDEIIVALKRFRTFQYLDVVGFHERTGKGLGRFITPEAIEARPPTSYPDLFRGISGLRFQDQGGYGYVPFLMAPVGVGSRNDEGNVPPGYCRPRIYVDGIRMSIQPRHGDAFGVTMEELVNVRDIMAVEVYAGPASVPFEWGGTQGSCGVILIWTGGR